MLPVVGVLSLLLSKSVYFKFPLVRRIDFCFQLIIISSNIIFCSFFLFSSHSFFLLSFLNQTYMYARTSNIDPKVPKSLPFLSNHFGSLSDWVVFNDLSSHSCIYSPITFILLSPTSELLIQNCIFRYRNYILFFLYSLCFFDTVWICFPLHHWE